MSLDVQQHNASLFFERRAICRSYLREVRLGRVVTVICCEETACVLKC
jgi:hypothetical protein